MKLLMKCLVEAARSVSMEDSSINSLFEKAKRAYGSDQYSDCISYCEMILGRNDATKTERILVMHLFADALLDLEKYPEAVELYGELLALDVSDIAFANRGFALMEMNQWDRALSDYLEAISINPDNLTAVGFAAECYLRLGKLDEVLSFLQREIVKRPSSGRLHALLGEAYSAMGEWPEAYSAFQRAVDLDPSDSFSKRSIMEIEKSAGEDKC